MSRRICGSRVASDRASAAAVRRRRGSERAYTLIEMLVALIMFALISVAVAFMLGAALRGHAEIRRSADAAQEIRALMNVISRDLRSAFVVTGNPGTYFVASGIDSGVVLQLTVLGSRLRPEVLSSDLGSQDLIEGVPQSDVQQVAYELNPDTGVLSRVSTSLPGQENIPEALDPAWVLSRHVRSLSFQFVDSSGNTRSDWNFQNETSTDGATASSSYDTTLPSRVDVEIELDGGGDMAVAFRTSVMIANTEPQPAGQAPPPPAQSGGDGAGGAGGGGGGGGGAPAP